MSYNFWVKNQEKTRNTTKISNKNVGSEAENPLTKENAFGKIKTIGYSLTATDGKSG